MVMSGAVASDREAAEPATAEAIISNPSKATGTRDSTAGRGKWTLAFDMFSVCAADRDLAVNCFARGAKLISILY
jgi:hypothetical protein